MKKIIGNSSKLKEALKIVKKVANTDTTVLVTGESGTGKELFVREIHKRSKRSNKPFVPINCGAIPKELLESELFGHEKGAFTHAIRSRPGRFELANGGTLFLDEIAELDVYLQVKLLRAIQEKEFERVGGIKTIKVDVRIVAATNKDLENEVQKGNFREDLFYRLNVVNVHIPPLRERKEDILLLANHFLSRFCVQNRKNKLKFHKEVEDALVNYSWPGNVRELENLMERLTILCESDTVYLEDLPLKILKDPNLSKSKEHVNDSGVEFQYPTLSTLKKLDMNLKDLLEEIENKLIIEALERSKGVKNRAAQLLGLKRTTLIEKLKKKKIKV
ncbi:sigma-54 dependent transcriptional regulator [Desulfothermus okinawensis JCM 13304]